MLLRIFLIFNESLNCPTYLICDFGKVVNLHSTRAVRCPPPNFDLTRTQPEDRGQKEHSHTTD